MTAAKLVTMIAALLFACAAATAAQGTFSAVTAGVRQHSNHDSDAKDLAPGTGIPFSKGDLSYLLAYEYHESSAFWQFGLGYCPHATSTSYVDNVESVITPQMHLVFKENLLMMGVGVLKHYVNMEQESKWTNLYWELRAGLHLPISTRIDLQFMAYYQFDEWGDIGHFKSKELDVGMNLSYMF